LKKIFKIFLLFVFPFITYSQEVNSKAPEFSAADINGNIIKLSDLSGKVVLVDFWASWCIPCKKSMPHLVQTFNSLSDSSFTIVSVNVDTEKEKIKEFQSSLGIEIPFTIIFDKESKLPALYNVEGMPTVIIIDKQGTIKLKEVGFDDSIEEKIDKTINKLLK